MRIAVFGATGLVGSPVAEEIRRAGHELRVVSRNARKASRHFGPGSDIVEGDAEDGIGLETALDGCQGVLLSVSGPREDRCVANVLEVAKATGLERLMYVSGCTVVPENAWFPMAARKLEAERLLAEGPVPWTVLAPGWFYETLSRFVRDGRAAVIGNDPTAYHFVAAREFAGIVRKAFEMPEAADRRFVVHGPEGMTIREALVRYCRVKHPQIEKVSQPPVWVLKAMASVKRNPQLKEALALMTYFQKVGELGDPTETNDLFGAPALTLESWLRD
jgi:uncharacterized protein YbjT (DUF2867 family)